MKENRSNVNVLNNQLQERNEEVNGLKNKVEQCLIGILQAKVNGGLLKYKNMLMNQNIPYELRQSLCLLMKKLIEDCQKVIDYLKHHETNERDKKFNIMLEQGYHENIDFISNIQMILSNEMNGQNMYRNKFKFNDNCCNDSYDENIFN